jgi:hypothetical protein
MIEQEIIQAIRDKKDFSTPKVQDMHREKEGRRDVLRWSDMDNFVYELWGHTIAKGDSVMKILLVSDCGYPTATTKSRLNAIFAALDIPMTCSIRKKEMVYYYNGHELPDIEKAKGMYGEYNINTGTWQVTIA